MYLFSCLDLPLRSHINPSYFRKTNRLSASDREENCVANTIFRMELYQDIFTKYLSLHSKDIAQDHRFHWTYLCGEKNTGQKSLSFLGPNIWSNINPSIKNVKTSSSFMHTLKKNILLETLNNLQTEANSNNYQTPMIDIII